MLRTYIVASLALLAGGDLLAQQSDANPTGLKKTSPADTATYVERVMSRDANGDNVLSGDEIPPPLARELKKYDLNNDGNLSRAELLKIKQPPPPMGRGRRGRGRNGEDADTPAQVAPDAALVEQILQFALSFDKDKDGGLNASELTEYANALAERRRQGRARGGRSATVPGGPDDESKPKGLGAAGDDSDSGFGASPRQAGNNSPRKPESSNK